MYVCYPSEKAKEEKLNRRPGLQITISGQNQKHLHLSRNNKLKNWPLLFSFSSFAFSVTTNIIEKLTVLANIHGVKYCVFSEDFKIFRTLAFLCFPSVSVRCSRTDRVQKNHNILRKKNNI